jgi:ABC-type tungstate transport system permease subunit
VRISAQRCRFREDTTLTRYIKLLSASFGFFSALAVLNPASAETLRMGGTGAVSEMLRQIGPAFEAETGITLQVVASLGTSGGNAAAADGVLGISVAGRDLKKKEAERA